MCKCVRARVSVCLPRCEIHRARGRWRLRNVKGSDVRRYCVVHVVPRNDVRCCVKVCEYQPTYIDVYIMHVVMM